MNPPKVRTDKCNACGTSLPHGTIYFCAPCWARVPSKDRVLLYNMHARKQDTTSKVCAIVRKLKGGAS